MKLSTSVRAALVFAALAVPASALASPTESNACKITVQVQQSATISPYDALLAADYIAPMQIVLTNDGNKDCDGTLSFSADGANRSLVGPSGGTLAYLIVAESSANTILYDPVSNTGSSIAVHVPTGGSTTVRPQLRVAGGQRAVSGTYQATLTVNFNKNNGIGDVITTSAPLAAEVVASVQANFVGAGAGDGSTATLTLGELSTNLTRSIGLQIRGNSDVDVTVSSENHGALARTGGGGSVRYHMGIGATTLDLTHDATLAMNLGDDSLHGIQQNVTVTIGDISQAPAGEYLDTVTFHISGR